MKEGLKILNNKCFKNNYQYNYEYLTDALLLSDLDWLYDCDDNFETNVLSKQCEGYLVEILKDTLLNKEYEIIKRVFGFDNTAIMSYHEISDELGLNTKYIGRAVNRSLRKLKKNKEFNQYCKGEI